MCERSANNDNVTKPKNARAMPKKCQMTGRCECDASRSSVCIASEKGRGRISARSIWLLTHFLRPHYSEKYA